MKKHMMIIGCEIVSSDESNPSNSLFKLTLMELKLVKMKQKMGVMGAIMKGADTEELVQTVENLKQRYDVMFITLGEWRDCGYKIGRHVTLELLPDDTTGGIK